MMMSMKKCCFQYFIFLILFWCQVPAYSENPETLQEKLTEHIKFQSSGYNKIGLIQITNKESSISQSTWIYVKNALDYYRKTKPDFIILELNTPGGEVFAAEKISDALKDFDTQ